MGEVDELCHVQVAKEWVPAKEIHFRRQVLFLHYRASEGPSKQRLAEGEDTAGGGGGANSRWLPGYGDSVEKRPIVTLSMRWLAVRRLLVG